MTDPVKPPARKGPSLMEAARASSSRPPVTPGTSPSKSTAPGGGISASGPGATMHRAGSSTTITSGSSRSTPAPSETVGSSAKDGIGKMNMAKFKPRVPIRRNIPDAGSDVKPETQNSSPGSRGGFRGGPRGRGRGGGHIRPVMQGTASGVFGSARPASVSTMSRSPTKSAPMARFSTEDQVDEYSSDEDGNRANVIDIALVSGLDESAPTSLWRDRRVKEKKGKGERKGRVRAADGGGVVSGFTASSGMGEVKDEPISPDKLDAPLPRVSVREDDDMMDEDSVQDRDVRGRRISVDDNDEVNEAQRVDLSESESEEDEEDMEGDFVLASGMDQPEDKLYMFQFPHLFPQFVSKAPVDLTQDTDGADTKEGIRDVKPNPAGRRKKAPPAEGRIGTLVVMRSGRVKMVLGDDIVMNVTPGVPSTFVQNLTHLDEKHKSTTVLGEVNKTFVVTPDVDKLLQELYLNGGMTPGDKAAAERRRQEKLGVKLESGLVKMEVD